MMFDHRDFIFSLMRSYKGRIFMPFGAGVNSWAMLLLMRELGYKPGFNNDFRVYHMNHQSDWPEIYEHYNEYAARYGVEDIETYVEHFNNLFDYYWHKETFPSIQWRDCTDKFKTVPGNRFIRHNAVKTPIVRLIGFDDGEKKRGSSIHFEDIYLNVYLLQLFRMTRADCEAYIQVYGIEIPPKSNCWLCPMQSNARWQELKTTHPDLFDRAVALENRCNARRQKQGKRPLPLNNKKFLSDKFSDYTHDYLVPYDFERITDLVHLKFLMKYGGLYSLSLADEYEMVVMRVCERFGVKFQPIDDYHAMTWHLNVTDNEIRKYITVVMRENLKQRPLFMAV